MTDDRRLPTTVEEARDRVDAGWAVWSAQLSRYTPEQMTTLTDDAGWTIADHIAHVAEWERVVINLIRERTLAFQTLGFDEETWDGHSMDWQNEQVRRRTVDWPLEDVLRFSQETHAELVETLASVTFADLERRIRDKPDAPLLLDDVMGDTEAHYAAHLPWIAAIAEDN